MQPALTAREYEWLASAVVLIEKADGPEIGIHATLGGDTTGFDKIVDQPAQEPFGFGHCAVLCAPRNRAYAATSMNPV